MDPDELDFTRSFVLNYPKTAAREIEKQPVDATYQLINELSAVECKLLLSELLPAYAARLCSKISIENWIEWFTDVNTEQIIAILRYIDVPYRETLINALPQKKAALYRLLLSYTEDTVGAWMTTSIVMLPEQISVKEGLIYLANLDKMYVSNGLPVINESKHLVGMLSLKKLLVAKSDTPLFQLVKTNITSLNSRASLQSIIDHEAWLSFDALPVLNRKQQLVGLLRHLDLRKSLQSSKPVKERVVSDELYVALTKSYFNSLGALFGLIFKRAAEKTIEPKTPRE